MDGKRWTASWRKKGCTWLYVWTAPRNALCAITSIADCSRNAVKPHLTQRTFFNQSLHQKQNLVCGNFPALATVCAFFVKDSDWLCCHRLLWLVWQLRTIYLELVLSTSSAISSNCWTFSTDVTSPEVWIAPVIFLMHDRHACRKQQTLMSGKWANWSMRFPKHKSRRL